MNDVLRPCRNLSAYELIQVVCLILVLLVNRLEHGDASDLVQDQVPELWMLTVFNILLAVVRTNYFQSLKEAAEDIQKDLVERLALLAVYCSTRESTEKFEGLNNLIELVRNSPNA